MGQSKYMKQINITRLRNPTVNNVGYRNNSFTVPLMSLCTIRVVCKKDTPWRICLVYFLVKLSFKAPCCLMWSCTEPCGKFKNKYFIEEDSCFSAAFEPITQIQRRQHSKKPFRQFFTVLIIFQSFQQKWFNPSTRKLLNWNNIHVDNSKYSLEVIKGLQFDH